MSRSINSAQAPEGALPNNSDFMIAWICAIRIEYRAVLELLDEKYDSQLVCKAQHDDNTYTLGRIGLHPIVVVVPPVDAIGIVHATSVASDLKSSFPSVRFALMVGIGGGAPTTQDIRLGDVVIGTKIVPYRCGQKRPDGFHCTGNSKPAPVILRAKITELETQLFRRELNIQQSIDEVGAMDPRTAGYWSRPGQDYLFRGSYLHQAPPGQDCRQCVASPSTMVTRKPRPPGQRTVVHAGAVASADQVMKDAWERDKVARKEGTICFEMESAGIMERLECLPIRGISDYADSHKNDEWQPYAALSAAVCAKALLSLLYPNEISGTKVDVTPEEIHRFVDMAVKTADLLPAARETDAEHGKQLQLTTESLDLVQQGLGLVQDWFENIEMARAEDAQKSQVQVTQIGMLEKSLNEALEKLQNVVIDQQQMSNNYVTRAEWAALEKRVSEQESRLRTLTNGTSKAMTVTSEILASARGLSGNPRLGFVSDLLKTGAKMPEILEVFYSGLKGTPLRIPSLPTFQRPNTSFMPGLSMPKFSKPNFGSSSSPENSKWNPFKSGLKSSSQPTANSSSGSSSPSHETDIPRPRGNNALVEELNSRDIGSARLRPTITASTNRLPPPPPDRAPLSGQDNVKRLVLSFERASLR